MNYKEFIELVIKTRRAQTDAKRFNTSVARRLCKTYEDRLDAEISDILRRTGQKDGKSLFD